MEQKQHHCSIADRAEGEYWSMYHVAKWKNKPQVWLSEEMRDRCAWWNTIRWLTENRKLWGHLVERWGITGQRASQSDHFNFTYMCHFETFPPINRFLFADIFQYWGACTLLDSTALQRQICCMNFLTPEVILHIKILLLKHTNN